MRILLEDVYKKTVTFLNRKKYKYMVIGGIAVGTLGEPRLTADVDIDVYLNKKQSAVFLSDLKENGFAVDIQRCQQSIKETGTFKVKYSDFHIDFIICSTNLEKEALKRSKEIALYKTPAKFPTPEDLILLKVIPGRPQDLLDIDKIVKRNKGKLDVGYILKWARDLSDVAEDMRFYNYLKKALSS